MASLLWILINEQSRSTILSAKARTLWPLPGIMTLPVIPDWGQKLLLRG